MAVKVSVIGLGKLGSCSASCFSSRGFETIGVDINQNIVDLINDKKAPFVEPRLQELIDKSENRLKATTSYEEAINNSDVTFLIVPTPSKENGHFSNDYLKTALTELSKYLKKADKPYHLFVITSTVMPSSTENEFIPLIENISGKKLNKDFGICYNPEFIALGNIINNFLNPDMLLIGESNEFAGQMLSEIYEKVCENKPYYARMSLISSEITKISLNSYVTMKITFANTLANICENISGANIDDITKALGADKRISPYYLKGGLGYGGPCFPRDNRAFASFAKDNNYDALLAKTTDKVNNLQIEILTKKVMSNIKNNNETVSILGLAYKPDTPVIEESASIKLIENLLKNEINVIVYDSLATENTKEYFGEKIQYANSIKECLEKSSISIIALPTKEFKEIDNSYISKEITVIDCWRILDEKIFDDKVKYISLGSFS